MPNLLLETRARLGLSQAALADYLGVHPLTVCRWESGARAVPGPVVLALRAIERHTNNGGYHDSKSFQ
jgi:DNA-binding transcriptional regulator YiaG